MFFWGPGPHGAVSGIIVQTSAPLSGLKTQVTAVHPSMWIGASQL